MPSYKQEGFDSDPNRLGVDTKNRLVVTYTSRGAYDCAGRLQLFQDDEKLSVLRSELQNRKSEYSSRNFSML